MTGRCNDRSRSRRSFPSRPASICRGHEINTPSLLKKQATRVTTKRRRESVVFSGDSFIPTLQRQEHSSASRLTTPYSLFAELLHRHSPSNVHSSASRSRARRPFSTNHSITLGLVYNRRYQPAVFLSPENIQGSIPSSFGPFAFGLRHCSRLFYRATVISCTEATRGHNSPRTLVICRERARDT